MRGIGCSRITIVSKGDGLLVGRVFTLINEALFLALNKNIVIEQLSYVGTFKKKKKKIIQFTIIFILLRDGHPTSDLQSMREVLDFMCTSLSSKTLVYIYWLGNG